MNVTERDEEQAAAATSGEEAPGSASAPQVARARDDDRTPGSGNSDGTTGDTPWWERTGKVIRSGTRTAISHPRAWPVWDQHPASPRATCARARQAGGWESDDLLIRWPTRAVWSLIICWSALFCLIAVAPRNKTCWLIAGVILIAWLTW